MPGVRPLCTNQPRGIRIALALQKILMEAVAGSPFQCKGADMERLFKLVYFAGMLAEIILRMPYERQRRQIPKIDQRVSRTERGLLAVPSLGGFFIPLIYSLTSWLDFANYRWSPATKARVGSIGTVLLGAAIWLFWRSHRDLGKNWSPSLEISAQQTLITHGVCIARSVTRCMPLGGY